MKFDERVVSSDKVFIPPEKRDIGMVFQSYAVWPHMTVFDNVAYPLRIKKMDKDAIQKKVDRVLAMVHLTQYAQRIPSQLSGGQQQRVALARALVAEPALLLLDEPLSNLDAKLRESMRFEIKEIQREYGITVLYVTHDQTEAMAMSDRIVVINRGVIQQIGVPREIYSIPPIPSWPTSWARSSFWTARSRPAASSWTAAAQRLPYEGDKKGRVIVGVRPEHVKYAPVGQGTLSAPSRATSTWATSTTAAWTWAAARSCASSPIPMTAWTLKPASRYPSRCASFWSTTSRVPATTSARS